VCWSGAVVAMLQAVTSTDARCLTSLTSLAYGTDVHGLALPLQVVVEVDESGLFSYRTRSAHVGQHDAHYFPYAQCNVSDHVKCVDGRPGLVVENPILEKVRSGGSAQTFALPTKKKVSKQMEVASAPTYASILKKGLKWAPVTVHSF